MNTTQHRGVETKGGLRDFIEESNRIEGIFEVRDDDEKAHQALLSLDVLTVEDVEEFVRNVAARPLRDRPGMNVRVGNHRPPPGGPEIRAQLADLLGSISPSVSEISPYEFHVAYEKLHPFLDGNGRSGRALWAWQMLRDGLDPFALPFLHRFYYQSLDASREPVSLSDLGK